MSDVIHKLKRLKINSASGTAVQLLRESVLNELNAISSRIEIRKEYAMTAAHDPRFKTAVFQSRKMPI